MRSARDAPDRAGRLPGVRAPDGPGRPGAHRQRRRAGGGALAGQAGAGAARGHRAARGRRRPAPRGWSGPTGRASWPRRASCSTSPEAYARMANAVNPYGDGQASERILAALGGPVRMRLLVTGGTGFIGSHLAEEGRRRGAEVVVLGLIDRPEERANAELLAAAGRRDRAGQHHGRRALPAGDAGRHPRVPPRRGDARGRQERRVLRAGQPRGHPAAAGGGGGSARSQRFVYCSTIGIYGHRAPGITREDSPLAPGNIYERTKVAAERMVRELAPAARGPVRRSSARPTSTGRGTSGC